MLKFTLDFNLERGYNLIVKSYAQYCPIAAALDVIGERWSLLIIRELSVGSRRFSDIRKALPGLSPNLLVERLKDLEASDVISRNQNELTSSRCTYSLTEKGSELLPMLQFLSNWGEQFMPTDDANTQVSPVSAIRATLLNGINYKFLPPEGIRISLIIDGMKFKMYARGPVPILKSGLDPKADVHLKISAQDLVKWRQGRLLIADALANGRIYLKGTKVDQFLMVFSFVHPDFKPITPRPNPSSDRTSKTVALKS